MTRNASRNLTMIAAASLLVSCTAAQARGLFGHDASVPQWALDAAQTPTPANAGDASRVILYDEYVETIDAQGRATEREREAVRILKPQAREEGCGVSYDVDEKVNYFRAWTITADGKQFQAKDTDFVERGDTGDRIMLSTRKFRVVRPPAADVGAVVVCETEELMAPYQQETVWRMQADAPFVFEALEVDLPPGFNYAAAWHRYDPVKPVEVAHNCWRWELKDVKGLDLRQVKLAPNWWALAARVSVHWGDAAWGDKESQWRALGIKFTNLEEKRPDPTPEITAKAAELVAGAPDFYAKLKNITEYIQKNVEYFVVERGIGGWQAHFAGDIFRNRYGDCKDKTTLLISMLQAVGIHAYYLAVDTRRGFVDPDAPSLYGNHMITAIQVPAEIEDPRLPAISKGKDGTRYLIFDPTNQETPVGDLPAYEEGSYGILAAGPASQLLALPVLPPEANKIERQGAFTLSADGVLSGWVDTMRTGFNGAELRGQMRRSDDKERRANVEKSVAYDLPGVVLNSFEFVNPDGLDKPVQLNYKVTVPQYAHRAGPLVLVRARVMGHDSLGFDEKPRTLPINLYATGRRHDSFDIALPAGYAVDELPDPVNLDMDFASYHAKTTANGNVLHYEREYVVRQVELPASRAGDFRKLESAIVEDEQGAAVLKKQ